jgi:DNA primase
MIDEILSKLTFDIIQGYLPNSSTFKIKGHDYVGLCPSGHGSTSKESFQISTMSPVFKCWNCGAQGNYIHLVEFCRHGVSSQGHGYTETFAETCKFLANELGIQEDTKFSLSPVNETLWTIIDLVITSYQTQINERIYKELETRYGWTDREFIQFERIGYAGKCPGEDLLEFYTVNQLLSTGLFYPGKRGGIFHIYQDRIVFPYQVMGRIRYSIGRLTTGAVEDPASGNPKYRKQLIKSDKRPYVSDQIKNPILTCAKDNDELVITEGITDFLILKKNGINVASAVTTRFQKNDYDDIVSFSKKFKRIYIANDNELNEAGRKGADDIARLFISEGINPQIIILPRNDDQPKMDVAEYFMSHNFDDFSLLKSSAKTYLDLELEKINPTIDKSVLTNYIEPVLQLLKNLPDDQINLFIYEKIAKYFKLTSLKSTLTALKNRVIAYRDTDDKKNKKHKVFESQKHIELLSPGQDFLNNILFYTVTHPMLIEDKKGFPLIVNNLFVITSGRKLYEVVNNQLVHDGLAFYDKISSEYKSESWTFNSFPFSVSEYINKSASVNPAELFIELRTYFNRFIFFKKDGIADHLALLIMTSYFFMVFHTVGYIHLWAEKRSGKTTAMELLNELGFNARMSSSISDAAVFRSIENHRPLLLIDEAENLNPSPKQREMGINNERLELYKSGYKKNGKATRCEGQNNTVIDFSNYCIKVFASIKSLDSTLEDRTIIHEFKRAKSDALIEEWRPDKTAEAFKVLRNKLHCFGLEYAGKVSEIYKNMDVYNDYFKLAKVQFRSREVWGPYLATALLVDQSDPSLNLFYKMLNLALYTIENKEAFSRDSKSLVLIEKLYLWIRSKHVGVYYDSEDMFLRVELINEFVKNFLHNEDVDEDWSYVNYAYLKEVLRKYDVINSSSELDRAVINGRRGKALVIKRGKLLEALITYKGDCCEEVIEDNDKMKSIMNKESEK